MMPHEQPQVANKEAEALCKLLAGNQKCVFQTFGPKVTYPRTFYGVYSELEQELVSLNQQGHDIFVTVNKTRGPTRKKADILMARAVWQEDDCCTDKIPELAPHIVVETSPGHFHRWWLLDLTDDLSTWEKVQKHMVIAWDSDKNATDVSRVLRLPGFYNHKRECQAKLVKIQADLPRYSLAEVVEAMGVEATPSDETELAPAETRDKIDEALEQYYSGKHIHGPIRGIMMALANNGVSYKLCKAACNALINDAPIARHDRDAWEKAMRDLPAMLNATYSKIADESAGQLVGVTRAADNDINWPPGRMGELARAATKFLMKDYAPVGILTAIGLIAGVAGRHYNIHHKGLNVGITIMIRTGQGKDGIHKFIERMLTEVSLGTNGLQFYGDRGYTGPKALINSLEQKPSQIACLLEAGFLLQQQSGDKAGLTGLMLSIFTASGQDAIVQPYGYSRAEDSQKAMRAVAYSYINEGTPETMKGCLKDKDAISTGELTRQWIFDFSEYPAKFNEQPFTIQLSDETRSRFNELVIVASQSQKAGRPDSVIHIELPKGWTQYRNEMDARSADAYAVGETAKANMYTRAAEKVMVLAALCAIINSDSLLAPEISQADWEWAKWFHEYQMTKLEEAMNEDTNLDAAMHHSMRVIKDLLSGVYKKTNLRLTQENMKAGIFTQHAFKIAVEKNRSVKQVAKHSQHGKDIPGWQVVLNYMVQEKLLELLPTQRKNSVHYKCTQEFSRYFNTHVKI